MQGDPLAMSMYALGILPLIQKLKGTQQVWFADDAAAGGSLENLKEWWSRLLKLGQTYGYHPSPAKTWLVVKEEHVDQAETLFGNSGVNVTSSGHKHLGAALGCNEFVRKFVEKKVSEWCDEITCLSTIAKREPQAAHSAFIHGMPYRWNYVLRTVPNVSELLSPPGRCYQA